MFSKYLSGAILAVIIGLTLFNFLSISWLKPHGRYDAWAIWNMRAREIYRSGENWENAFSPVFFHPDYPLMLPLSISRLWSLTGDESQSAPILLSAIFSFGSIGLIFLTIKPIKGLLQASVAAILLAGAPALISFGAIQYADIPLAVFILCTIFFLMAGMQNTNQSSGKFVLAGLAAGSAAWTKNEGLMFLAITFFVIMIASLKKQCKTQSPPPIFSFILGTALPLAAVFYFKIMFAPSNDWVSTKQLALLPDRILDLQRYATIFSLFPQYLMRLAEWPIPILPILVLYALLADWKKAEHMPALSLISLILILQLLGYLGVYVITPLPIATHMHASMPRLLFQLYPAFLLFYFSTIQSPQEICENTPHSA